MICGATTFLPTYQTRCRITCTYGFPAVAMRLELIGLWGGGMPDLASLINNKVSA